MLSKVLFLRPTKYKRIKKPNYFRDICSLLFQIPEKTSTINMHRFDLGKFLTEKTQIL